MIAKLLYFLTALAVLVTAQSAHAAISCSISSNGFTSGYQPNSATVIITQTSYSITCTRGVTTDPTTTSYSVKVNNGQFAAGTSNQAASGANRLMYDVFTNSTCATQWKGNITIPSTAGTITMSGLVSTTVTQNFWGCIAAGISPAAGTYTDTVIMTPTYSLGVLGGTGTFPVTIITPPVCTVTTSPGSIAFNYTAFQTGATSASTTFGVACSNLLPYTMAVSPASGALTGINYALTLPASSTGTGGTQTHTISGTAAAGQAGSCTVGTCTSTQTTTLTITY